MPLQILWLASQNDFVTRRKICTSETSSGMLWQFNGLGIAIFDYFCGIHMGSCFFNANILTNLYIFSILSTQKSNESILEIWCWVLDTPEPMGQVLN